MTTRKIKVKEVIYRCPCGSCDLETRYVPVHRPKDDDGYPRYIGVDRRLETIMRHCIIVE